MLSCCARLVATHPFGCRRTQPRQPAGGRRGMTKVSAAWVPNLPNHGGFRQPHPVPEEPERFGSLFACSWIPPTQNPHTVFDARDAMEACSGLWGDERRECLSVFGIDGQSCDTFYSTVFALESALSQDTDPEEEASHRGQERC